MKKRPKSLSGLLRTGYYTAADLEALPTLINGQSADLKIDTGVQLVWLYKYDDHPVGRRITIEEVSNKGHWRPEPECRSIYFDGTFFRDAEAESVDD
jgi:hypothetical protein